MSRNFVINKILKTEVPQDAVSSNNVFLSRPNTETR